MSKLIGTFFDDAGNPMTCPYCGENGWTNVSAGASGKRKFPTRVEANCVSCGQLVHWNISKKLINR